jgi:hypothetical protein
MMRIRITFPYRKAFVYVIIGALWILFSDKMLVSLFQDPNQIQHLSTDKGWL